jgi:hypothetical protein
MEAVLRDGAVRSFGTRLMDDVDMIRTSKTLNVPAAPTSGLREWPAQAVASAARATQPPRLRYDIAIAAEGR